MFQSQLLIDALDKLFGDVLEEIANKIEEEALNEGIEYLEDQKEKLSDLDRETTHQIHQIIHSLCQKILLLNHPGHPSNTILPPSGEN